MPQKDNSHKYQWIELPRIEKAEEVINPYRGFYSLYRFYADSENVEEEQVRIEDIKVCEEQQLCLIEINLIAYSEQPISEHALANIHRICKYFTSIKKQIILRFLYDWEGKAIVSEPKEFERILSHMEQLEPILQYFERNIYILQGLFLGNWGEMHSSRYLDERYMVRLMNKLGMVSGSQTQIAVRCPSYYRMIFKTYEPLDIMSAYSNKLFARISLFNDGILASESDYGTYGDILRVNSKSYSDKWIRKEEIEFQNRLCKYVSNGGEVIHDCEWNHGTLAMEELKKMRISYLHIKYDKKVLDKWKGTMLNLSKSIWNQRSAYDYIKAHMGYRFTLIDTSFKIEKDSERFRILLRIVNRGFSPCYHKFKVYIVVRTLNYDKIEEFEVETDTRTWLPEKLNELEVSIENNHREKGIHAVGIKVYDERSEQSIVLANTFSSPDHLGVHHLGNVRIY